MPVYDFSCPKCNKVYELKMTIAEHTIQKESLTCQECYSKLIQVVTPLNFKLSGGGWFSQDYAITQQEMNSNLDLEKKIEDVAGNFSEKDKNVR